MLNLCPVSVIILTLNEEITLPTALKSVVNWASQVFVVDSFSTDRTADIARSYGAAVYENEFKGYTAQRNWALKNLPINNDWVIFLDADEYLSEEIKSEISVRLQSVPADAGGFYTKIRFEFMGKWLKHGDIYNSLIRMVRIGRASYINTGGCREKLMVQGRVLTLDSYIVHDDRKTIIDWYMKQGDRILLDAQERLENGKRAKNVSAPSASSSCTIEGSRSVTLRNRFLLRLPGPVRPFAQFFYRYILRLGFLDGWPGFVYHFLLQFWYPLMVEALYHQLKRKQHSNE